MGKTRISMGLSADSIDAAIKELNKYKADFLRKVNIFRKKVADYIASEADIGFKSSQVDDTLELGPRPADVEVRVDNSGENITVVIADGADAVWCEFGAGVFHNGPVGSSPNPNGGKLGFTIGSYGKGFGSRKVWGYKDADDQLILTHGTQATMPMYRAKKQAIDQIYSIAKEVFG